jgi:hypothetical protein
MQQPHHLTGVHRVQRAGRLVGQQQPTIPHHSAAVTYHQAFRDVTTGTDTVTFPAQTITGYRAAPGWDPVTGWGSPNAQELVPLPARYAST